jgi:nucleoside diphosphate kinase
LTVVSSRNLILYYFYDKGAIIQAIIEHEFEVRYEKTYTFRPDEIESLYIKYRNKDFFKSLIEAYTM